MTNYMDLCLLTPPPSFPTHGLPDLIITSCIVRAKMYLHMEIKYGTGIWKRNKRFGVLLIPVTLEVTL